MSWLTQTVLFIYDFLADDGWELLVGLAIILPLTYLVAPMSNLGGGLLIVVGILLTVTISLGRKLPKPRRA